MPHAAATWANLRAIREQAPLSTTSPTTSRWRSWRTACSRSAPRPRWCTPKKRSRTSSASHAHWWSTSGPCRRPGSRRWQRAARRAHALGKPWVLDPVGCGATPYRTRAAAQLVELQPSVIRGNASELLALAGAALGPDQRRRQHPQRRGSERGGGRPGAPHEHRGRGDRCGGSDHRRRALAAG